MKLYYAPGACSQAAHIVLHETGLPHSSVRTDIRAKRTEDGRDYFAINPKGAVPAIEFDNGEVLTENVAIMVYLGDQAPDSGLLPVGGLGRYRVIETLAYLSSELHKAFGPLFNPASGDEAKDAARSIVGKKLDFVEAQLEGQDFLDGDAMSVSDPYLFAMLGWTRGVGIDLTRWPNLAAFRERMKQRPAVQTVLRAEGLAD